MDPLSTAASVLTLLGACSQLTKFLIKVCNASKSADEDIQNILGQIQSLTRSTIRIQNLDKARSQYSLDHNTPGQQEFDTAWQCLNDDVITCNNVLNKILTRVEKIQKDAARYPDSVVKAVVALKLQFKESSFADLYKQLANSHRSIQATISAVQLQETWASRSLQIDFGEEASVQFSLLHRDIDELRLSLESAPAGNLRKSFAAAKAIAALGSSNKHFDVPQPISSIFTGCEARLKTLADLVFPSATNSENHSTRILQRRFIIHGLGGSGKTQFCCKFALENRNRFWGVFWIDGSSRTPAEQSLIKISVILGIEPNALAAKRWLSSCEKPWLLIVDNADDPEMDLEDLFPDGERGLILVTTRNPNHIMQGTVGEGFFNFSDGEPAAASELLLRAAHHPRPWTETVLEHANGIAQQLGYLPLAIIVAGRTILKRVCSLQDYLRFHEISWRKKRERAGRRKSDIDRKLESDPQLKVYATCDMMYRSLVRIESEAAQDAVELLKIFSFLHKENICLRMLIGAAINPEIEKRENAKAQLDQSIRSDTWLKKAFLILWVLMRPELPKTILPGILQPCPPAIEPFDEYRLREALAELSQRSLIMYHADNDSYLVHPIIHRWVRERPEMRISDQAIWCKAAETIISNSILLPPLASTAEDDIFHRSLLPHIMAVREYGQEIKNQFTRKNLEERGRDSQLKSRMTRAVTLALAKFSLVFTKCGKFQEALELQLVVHDFLQNMVGQEHPAFIRIELALAGTYWHLGLGYRAAQLQENALQNSTRLLGANHPDTLRIMDSLGTSRWMQGQYKQAVQLHEAAVEGLEQNLGSGHADVLRAKDHLGRVESKYFHFERASQLHLVAAEGLRIELGGEHHDTLTALDNLANVYMDLGTELDLEKAQNVGEQVLTIRKAKLGGEHYYTLWSMLTFARIRALRGACTEAEEIMEAGLSVAYQTLGGDHMGVLNARQHLAWIQHLGGQTSKAIDSLQDICARQAKLPSAVRGHSPDRLMCMYMLVECYRSAGRYDEGINTCADAIKGLLDLGGKEHPFLTLLERRLQDISRSREDVLRSVRVPDVATITRRGGF